MELLGSKCCCYGDMLHRILARNSFTYFHLLPPRNYSSIHYKKSHTNQLGFTYSKALHSINLSESSRCLLLEMRGVFCYFSELQFTYMNFVLIWLGPFNRVLHPLNRVVYLKSNQFVTTWIWIGTSFSKQNEISNIISHIDWGEK